MKGKKGFLERMYVNVRSSGKNNVASNIYRLFNRNYELEQASPENIPLYCKYIKKESEGDGVPFSASKKALEEHFRKMGEDYTRGFILSLGPLDKIVMSSAYEVAKNMVFKKSSSEIYFENLSNLK